MIFFASRISNLVTLSLVCMCLAFWIYFPSRGSFSNQLAKNAKKVIVALAVCGGNERVLNDSYMLIKSAVMFNERSNLEFFIVTEKAYNQKFVDQVSFSQT